VHLAHRSAVKFSSTTRKGVITMRSVPLLLAIALTAALPVAAQQKPEAKGGTAVASPEPGKAGAVRALEVSAEVVSIDKASRTLTLKGPKGRIQDVVIGP